MFQVLAQLSENFIFIYLGLSLFTDNTLVFQPPLIIVTVVAVCAARWVAVFPLSSAINWVIRYRARRRGQLVADELSYSYQGMLFWAGLRGAVGVALAALLTGGNAPALRATVLVVVVLTVIIFGGTTARMLEILKIRTGVVEEADSDDEFDIESFGGGGGGGVYIKRTENGIGYTPRRSGNMALEPVDTRHATAGGGPSRGSYVSGSRSPAEFRGSSLNRKNSKDEDDEVERFGLLGRSGNTTDSDLGSDVDISDLPPPARFGPRPRVSPMPSDNQIPQNSSHTLGTGAVAAAASATSAIRQLLTSEDPAGLFRQLDEDFIKPTLLLDSSNSRGGGGGGGHNSSNGHGGQGNGGAGPSGS
jgi:sodium/hydrogen exchanger-like protein 6/7